LIGAGPFGTAKPQAQWASFQLRINQQIAVAQAALTKSLSDDVAVARRIITYIKGVIDKGNLTSAAMLQALQALGQEQAVIDQAAAAAAQKRAAAAAKAKAKIEAEIQNSIDPINLEVQLARAQALGQPFVAILRKLRAAARAAIASGKLTLDQQRQAWQQIVSLNQQIKDAISGQTATFQVPAKLALRLARDQALGHDTTKDLLAIKAAILKFIRTHKKNIAALTDAYNQLAAINQQLGQTAQNAYGDYKKASLKAETAGLGLTPDQRRALEERLSQRGPGGTVPTTGVGAGGYIIDPLTGRPVSLDKGRHRSSPRLPQGMGTTGAPTYHETIKIILNIDGKRITEVVTKRQQGYRNRNPQSRRGPHAATATA
jgi:hypothetical protein